MPIRCQVPLRRLNQEEFGELSYRVLGEVFAIHHTLGCLFKENTYKRALAARCPDVRLEEPIEVSFRTFSKRYYIDVLVARGGVFEFKAVEQLTDRHRAQSIHYLLLCDLQHGMVVNMRPGSVEREYVNTTLHREERFAFVADTGEWDERWPGAALARKILLELLADWGTGLELPLYDEALTHFLGGESAVIRPVDVFLDSAPLGQQAFRHAADGVAFKLTAFEDLPALTHFHSHAERLVRHTALQALLWINIGRSRVTFTTVAPHRARTAPVA